MAHEWKIGDWCDWGIGRQYVWKLCALPGGVRIHLVNVAGSTAYTTTEDPGLKYLPDCTGWDWKPPKPIGRESESVVLAMRMAAEMFGGSDGVFNGAGFSQAMRQLSGVTCTLDGYVVATILGGRSDVEVLKGGSHYRMIGYEATTLNVPIEQAETPKPIESPEGYRLLTEGEVILVGDMWFDRVWYVHCSDSSHIGKAWNSRFYFPVARKIEPKYRPFANAAEFAPHRDKWVRWKENNGTSFCNRIASYSDTIVWVGAATECLLYKEAFEFLEFEDGTPFGVKE